MFNDPQWRPVPATAGTTAPSGSGALRPLRVGMSGIGTVGRGTWELLARNQEAAR